jgi:hypothetical protein
MEFYFITHWPPGKSARNLKASDPTLERKLGINAHEKSTPDQK